MGREERYQLRKAAGLYWLLDMKQDGAEMREPVVINESGAYIWEQYHRLGSELSVAEALSREFGLSVQEGLTDVRQFIQQLREQGMILQEE